MSAPAVLLARLLWVRDAAALPDQALAEFLGIEARQLDTLVNAHPERFAEETVFRLKAEERLGIEDAPVLAFTEAGVALLVGLLEGKDREILALLPRLAEARHLLTSHAELAARVALLEEKLELLVKAVQGEEEPEEKHRPIGFVADHELPHHLKDKERENRKRT
ncbi:MAG: ORF6N domain-containing protein [Acidobacteria bacterium]|nr:ORF6N domain-containing protein [Acidobacteriota bacterium]